MNEFEHAWVMKAQAIHDWAQRKGWWETERNDYEMIALMHSELSEAVEALRLGNHRSDKLAPYSDIPLTDVEEELADVVIRIMDTAQARGWNIAAAIEAKMKYNEHRPYRHGGLLA